jgi:hypothetical protein
VTDSDKHSSLLQYKPINSIEKFKSTGLSFCSYILTNLLGLIEIETTAMSLRPHDYSRRHNTQYNDTMHNDTQHNDTQHNDTQHNDTQNNDNQHNGLICDTQHRQSA